MLSGSGSSAQIASHCSFDYTDKAPVAKPAALPEVPPSGLVVRNVKQHQCMSCVPVHVGVCGVRGGGAVGALLLQLVDLASAVNQLPGQGHEENTKQRITTMW